MKAGEFRMKDTLFSILVPVYNVERYISACIESVLNQSYQNFELILVDDGSTDESGKVCDSYSISDERISVIHQKNGGLISARRVAISHAKGDYCIFLDSDDSLKENALIILSAYIQQYQADCIIYGMDRVSNGKVIKKYVPEINDNLLVTDKEVLYSMVFTKSDYNAIWRKAVKTCVFQGLDYSEYYHLSHGEDLLQSIEIYKYSKHVLFVKDSLYNYTVNPNSITQSIDINNYKIDFTIREKVVEFIESENVLSEEEKDKFYSFCISKLCIDIRKITRFNTSYTKIKEKLLEIKKSNYYSLLSKGKNCLSARDNMLWHLFINNAFLAIYSSNAVLSFIERWRYHVK